jgi:protein tyrosine/serine phosphatase
MANHNNHIGKLAAQQLDLKATLSQILPAEDGMVRYHEGSATPDSLASASTTIEESVPPSPSYGFPANFGEVTLGIYRSSFPRTSNFEHLSQLELKTILTLVSEEIDEEYLNFIKSHGIKHHQILIPPNKEAFAAIPPESMAQALGLLLNESNHPILVHCNKGKVSCSIVNSTPSLQYKHRTGCVIGCYRKMCGHKLDIIIDEYRTYAGIKARALDEKYIQDFDQHTMTVRLNDMIFRMAKESNQLLTPPPSDKSFMEPETKGKEQE